MPNTFALTLRAQNSYPASSVVQAATQQIPDLSLSENDLISGVFEVFGNSTTSANTLTPSGTTINSVLAGGSAVALTNPITNSTLVFTNFRGLYVTVTRRDPQVAPASTIVAPIAATTTSSAIGAGTKTFTVASGLTGIVDGMRVRVVPTGSTTEYMEGTATYATTVLTVVVDRFVGSASYTAWTVTGVVCAQIKSAGYGGVDTHATVPLPIRENGAFVYSSPVPIKIVNTNVLTVYLNGTTGLNVNILTIGS